VERKRNELTKLLEANQIENPMLEAKFNRLLNACNARKVRKKFIDLWALKLHILFISYLSFLSHLF